MAQVVLARRVRSQILALPWPLIEAVEEVLALLQREPEAGYPLRGKLSGLRSLRVGSYRIIYQLTDKDETVRVAAVQHRAIAYRSDPR